MPPTPPSKPTETLPALTSLRFGAAFMIYVLHFCQYAPAYGQLVSPAAMNQGVSFFFVLSGFVLTHAYGGRPLDPRKFWLARFARLYPMHLATLALILAVLPLPAARFHTLTPSMSLLSLFAEIALVHCWYPAGGVATSWNNVSWSIGVEFFFYAAFPFLLPRVKRNWPLTLAGAALCVIAVYAVGLALRLPMLGDGYLAPTLYDLGTYNPLARVFEFVLGMATYQVFQRYVAPLTLSHRQWTAIEAAAFSGAALWVGLAVAPINRWTQGALDVWFHSSGSVWAIVLVILAIARGRGAIGRALSWRPSVLLGEASFAFYMGHSVVLRGLRQVFGDRPPALGALALALLLAFALHVWVEKPMRDRILGTTAAAKPATAS